MRSSLTLCVVFGLVSVHADWVLKWADEFERLDYNNWQHEITAWGGGNYEFQAYTNLEENVYVRDGVLYIRPTFTTDRYGEDVFTKGSMNLFDYAYCSNEGNWGCFRNRTDVPPILSGRIRSYQRFSYKYGKIEVDAKMPRGDWLWPAVWLLPEDWVYGPWPRSGEIDIVETIGNRELRRNSDGQLIGTQRAGSTLHWGTDFYHNMWNLTGNYKDNEERDFGNFYKYTFEWNERQMRFYIGDENVLNVPSDDELDSFPGMWEWGKRDGGGWGGNENPWPEGSKIAPFDQKFHLILNVAVGGMLGFIPDDVTNGYNNSRAKPWRNDQPLSQAMQDFWEDRENWQPTWQGEDAAMQVRSVRYFEWDENYDPSAASTHTLSMALLLLVSVVCFS